MEDCPFCGSNEVGCTIDDRTGADITFCKNCSAQADFDVWNNRASQSDERFVKNFSIQIGQDAFRMFQPMMRLQLNDHYIVLPLENIKDWFNTIWDSQGSQCIKAIEAKRNLDQIFAELLSPFRDYSKIIKVTK